MKKIGLVAKLINPEVVKFCAEVTGWLNARGVEVYGDGEISKRVSAVKKVSREEMPDAVEAVLVLGGDGTMLYAARLVGGRKIPILGINMGGLGFLTAATATDAYACLEKALKGKCEIEERMMLSVGIMRGGKRIADYRVLNDAVIRGTIARLLKLDVRIDEEYVTTYRADGLIVATPTGSTGYSLSAFGPILYPTIHSIIIVPICPFNLTNRPVVIPDRMTVAVELGSEHLETVLTLDGQVDMPLKAGDVIEARRAEENVYLIRGNGKSYFDVMRERLMWEPRR
ncbi:MAG: NAD(+)/NADH kinase [Deltaproteobacteria bacterium]|nr:NAD(+)/NADH kinase [Deltaproteobacteria bacterium]